ncbi:hypothetical protein O3P69_005838 [Scylla paramamosain]|uniref:Uncharacterized protein n=1 Tax=Scylla paramamosain TaxID=85552 RepID=A0AAW0U539_SCYPA
MQDKGFHAQGSGQVMAECVCWDGEGQGLGEVTAFKFPGSQASPLSSCVKQRDRVPPLSSRGSCLTRSVSFPADFSLLGKQPSCDLSPHSSPSPSSFSSSSLVIMCSSLDGAQLAYLALRFKSLQMNSAVGKSA